MDQAAETLARAVQEGDVRAALGILRGLGLLGQRSIAIGSDDPITLESEAARRQEEAAIAEERDRFDRSLGAALHS